MNPPKQELIDKLNEYTKDCIYYYIDIKLTNNSFFKEYIIHGQSNFYDFNLMTNPFVVDEIYKGFYESKNLEPKFSVYKLKFKEKEELVNFLMNHSDKLTVLRTWEELGIFVDWVPLFDGWKK